MSSLLEEARLRLPHATDEELVVAIATELVDLLDLEPPVEPGMIASYQGIHRIERSPLGWAGCLLTDKDQLVIRVRSTDSPGRQRFTILHEVAHTFLPGYRHATQYRCTPMSTRGRREPNEVLCDIVASELLMPARYVRSAITQASFDLDAVSDLALDCDASLEAAARRFITLWPEPSLLIRMELTTKPRDPAGEPKLRVTSTLTNGTWPYMPVHKSIGKDHVLNQCLDGISVDGFADLDDLTRQPVGPVELHARHYPFVDSEGAHRERVLVIARHTH
ncbi:MAG: ImmA/IrrE family metallo-endopeptidase [Acidimicrobiales bacterium]